MVTRAKKKGATSRSRRGAPSANVKKGPKRRVRTTAATGKRSRARRVLAGTAKGTIKIVFLRGPVAIGRGVHRLAGWTKEQRQREHFEDGYRPEFDEVPENTRRPGAHLCGGCGKRFKTTEGLGRHFLQAHADEAPEPKKHERHLAPVLDMHATGRHRGKVAVRPGSTATRGRHRPAKSRTHVENLIKANRAKLDKIGARAVSDIDEIQALKAAFDAFSMIQTGGLSRMTETAVGMEQVFGGAAADAVNNYRLKLIALGIDPEQLTGLIRVNSLLDELGAAWTSWIVALKDDLKNEIERAKVLAS
jgi:hypothetical protein